MKLSVRLRAAWRAFKNPYHSGGVIGFAIGDAKKWGFVGSPIVGGCVDPKEIMGKAGNVNITVPIKAPETDRIRKEIKETSDVMRNWGNPAVREAYLAYKHRRNFG